MILIADSGGSKTDWALVSLPTDTHKYVLKVRTQGQHYTRLQSKVALSPRSMILLKRLRR